MKTYKKLLLLAGMLLIPALAVAQGSWNTGGGSSLPQTLAAPGVWTNTQMNENFQVIVGSGVNCSPSFIFSTMELGDFATDGVSGTACVPSTATAQLGVGVAGYATSAEPNSCGAAAPPCGGVGIEGNGLSVAAGTTVWGVVGVVQSTTGDAAQLFGSEIDITPLNSGDSGFGDAHEGAAREACQTARQDYRHAGENLQPAKRDCLRNRTGNSNLQANRRREWLAGRRNLQPTNVRIRRTETSARDAALAKGRGKEAVDGPHGRTINIFISILKSVSNESFLFCSLNL